MKRCRVDGCARKAMRGGMCSIHSAVYSRIMRHSSSYALRGDSCAIPWCGHSQVGGHGVAWWFCRNHADEWMDRNPAPDICSVADCENIVRSRGLCDRHYYRLTSTGFTHIPITKEEKCLARGNRLLQKARRLLAKTEPRQ